MSARSTESAHPAERMHAAESVAGGAGRERTMVKAAADRHAEAAMVHPVEVDDAIEVVEMVLTIDTGNRRLSLPRLASGLARGEAVNDRSSDPEYQMGHERDRATNRDEPREDRGQGIQVDAVQDEAERAARE